MCDQVPWQDEYLLPNSMKRISKLQIFTDDHQMIQRLLPSTYMLIRKYIICRFFHSYELLYPEESHIFIFAKCPWSCLPANCSIPNMLTCCLRLSLSVGLFRRTCAISTLYFHPIWSDNPPHCTYKMKYNLKLTHVQNSCC